MSAEDLPQPAGWTAASWLSSRTGGHFTKVQTAAFDLPIYTRAALDAVRAQERERCAHLCNGIAAGYAGNARRLSVHHATHAAGQRDGANECAAAIRAQDQG